MEFWTKAAALIIICFLLGWDLGLKISNTALKQERDTYKSKVEYIEDWYGRSYFYHYQEWKELKDNGL